MTATVEQLDERVTSLEKRMDELERLRAGEDRGLTDIAVALKAQRSLLQALATTQLEHPEKLDRLDRELRNGISQLQVGMEQVIGKLALLIERDGRP